MKRWFFITGLVAVVATAAVSLTNVRAQTQEGIVITNEQQSSLPVFRSYDSGFGNADVDNMIDRIQATREPSRFTTAPQTSDEVAPVVQTKDAVPLVVGDPFVPPGCPLPGDTYMLFCGKPAWNIPIMPGCPATACILRFGPDDTVFGPYGF